MSLARPSTDAGAWRTPAKSRRFQSPALRSATLSTLVHMRLHMEAAWSQLPARSSSVRCPDLKKSRHALPTSVCHGRHFRAHLPPLHRYYWRSLRTAFVRPCRPVVTLTRWRPNQWATARFSNRAVCVSRFEQFRLTGCQHLFPGANAHFTYVHSYNNLSRLTRTTKLRLCAEHVFSPAQAVRLSFRAPPPSVFKVRDDRVDVLIQRRVSRRLVFPFRRQRVTRR